MNPVTRRSSRRRTALLLIDFMNPLDFDGANAMAPQAVRAAKRAAALRRKMHASREPVIYANDNFGRWRSDFREVVQHCLHEDVTGRPIAELLAPDREEDRKSVV